MGSQNKEGISITKASPHTIKKFELIERYVNEWARKILGYNGSNGREGSKGLICIDCMSNSGLYHDNNGTLVDGTALRVVNVLNILESRQLLLQISLLILRITMLPEIFSRKTF